MSNMQRWMRENGITTCMLAQEMGISQTSVALKSTCKTHWQYSDMSLDWQRRDGQFFRGRVLVV